MDEEPKWTTKTGQQLYCRDMTTPHLRNVTRQFIRSTNAQVSRMIYASYCLDDDWAESTVSRNFFDDANFPDTLDILMRQPIWPYMRGECEKRGIDWIMLYLEVTGEKSI